MPVLALHHAQVFYPAGQEARARRFYYAAAQPSRGASSAYVDQLGLKEIGRPASVKGQAGLWFEASRCDYAAAKRSRGASSAYVRDPFGNKIELDQIP